ncbi:MAG: hypothetical protein HY904_26015 [Deltaproteobacteria bacterium]|nr:hypothetical protein [Deltaproteobacteria bacterium]
MQKSWLGRAAALVVVGSACAVACNDGDGGGGSSSSSSGGTSSSSSSTGGSSSSSTGGSSGMSSSGGTNYTPAQLTAARRALPALGTLAPPNPRPRPPSPSPGTLPTLGADAEYPAMARPIVLGINGQITALVNALRNLADNLEPTVYNSETHEFLWGPLPDNDSPLAGDSVEVYVRENVPQGDKPFRYEYALLRGMGTDQATFRMVIWGGANPDATNEDYGSGVTLWDFEANKAWLDVNAPAHGTVTRGRFVALYIRGPDQQTPTNVNTIVLANLHAFVPEDNPTAAPVTLDHLYGHVQDTVASHTVDFVDIAATGDIMKTDGGVVDETLDIRLAFFNAGLGRGEATVTGGDLGTSVLNGVECWDATVNRTYYDLQADTGADAGPTTILTEGTVDACGATFSQTLDALHVPSLAAVDAALLQALRNAAANGIPQP